MKNFNSTFTAPFLFAATLLFTGAAANAQTLQWAKAIGSTGIDVGRAMVVDASGNDYTTGYFQGTVDFDPGAGTFNLTSAGADDIFVSKLDSSGNFLWAKAMGGTGSDYGYSIAVDGSGNVYTTGHFSGTSDFDPGAGTLNLSSAGNADIFVSKLDSSGNFIWAKGMGGTGIDYGYSIAVDGTGNVYTSGIFNVTADFDPGAGTFNLTSAGSYDIFVSKLDASGNFLWAKQISGTGNDISFSIMVDGSGNVYTTGYFSGTADFDPGAGTFNLTSTGPDDVFVNKLDASGNFIWAKAMGGTVTEDSYSIAVDGAGNIYTTGSFAGTADFDPGPGTFNLSSAGSFDIFMSKLDPFGNFLWAKKIGGTNNDYAKSIAVDGNGNVYTTGQFQGTADFDPGAGTFNLTSAGGYDIFMSKLDISGNFVWAKAMGGTMDDIGYSIAVNGSGNIYTTGNFASTADLNPGAGTTNLVSAGLEDVFVAKYAPCNVTATTTVTNVSCNGGSNGTAAAAAAGGSSPYSYLWSGGNTTSTISGLAAGSYIVTVTDANGCTIVATASVNQPPPISIALNKTDVTCFGSCNGSINAAVSGANSPFAYTWSNGFSGSGISALCPGSYTVTVTDNVGCTAIATASITQPTAVLFTISATNVTCFGACNGTATANISGGTPFVIGAPYTKSWSNGSTGQLATNLCPGTYSGTVTDSLGCSATANTTITQPPSFTVTASITPASCYGCNNGSVSLTASGAIPPYTYFWSNGATSASLTGLVGGVYSVVTTDSAGCQKNDTIFIGQPNFVNVSFTNDTNNGCYPFTVAFTNTTPGSNIIYKWHITRSPSIDTIITSTNLTHTFGKGGSYWVQLCAYDTANNNLGCNYKYIDVKGSPGYFEMSADTACPGDRVWFSVKNNGDDHGNIYNWNFGDGIAGEGRNLFHKYDTAGVYPVKLIVYSSECGKWDTIFQTVTITNGYAPVAFYTTSGDYSCPFDRMTFRTVDGAGTFTWNFSDGTPPVTITAPEIKHGFPGIGNYIVTFSVTNGCGLSSTYSDTVFIQNGIGFGTQNLNNISIKQDTVCPGDKVNLEFYGSKDYSQYVWSYGDSSASDTNKFEIMHPYMAVGNYTVSLKITNGCGIDTTLFASVAVQSNVPLNMSEWEFFPVDSVVCPGNNIVFFAKGGAVKYIWNYGDGKTDTITNYTGDAAIAIHAFDSAGTYPTTLTIVNGCGNGATAPSSVVTVSATGIFPKPVVDGIAFIVDQSGDNEGIVPGCKDLVFISLVPGSQFTWNFGDGTTLTTNILTTTHKFKQQGEFLVSLKVTNSCGNSATFANVFTVTSSCPVPTVTVTGTSPTCNNGNNGTATATAAGGSTPYTYYWSNGKQGALNANIPAGIYKVTVSDANGMTATDSVALLNPPPMQITFTKTPAGCGATNGTAVASATGGSSPYSYSWSNGQTGSTATGLAAATYLVTVTAANGCKLVAGVTVNSTSGLAVGINIVANTCNGAGNGTAAAAAAGGSTPYAYSWSNGKTTASITGLQAGGYSVTVTDSTGCAISVSAIVPQPPPLNLQLIGQNPSGCGSANGGVNLTVNGGVSPYTFLWSDSSTTEDLINRPAGAYTVTVTDFKGCTGSKTILLSAASAATLTTSSVNATCNGTCNATATVSVSGGTSPFQYLWTNGGVNSTATGLCVGSYTVTVMDSTGCTATATATVSQPTALTINVTSSNSTCNKGDGSATVTASGGTAPYKYQWTAGDSLPMADSLAAGIYSVSVTDTLGCQKTLIATINDNGAPAITVNAVTHVSCFGKSTGVIDISVAGGATPYTYLWSTGAVIQDLVNLSAGPYEINVSDTNKCNATASITVNQPSALSVTATVAAATCGNAVGSATAVVSGGSTPYTYLWSDSAQTAANDSLSGGVYSLTITDVKSCSIVSSVAVTEADGPVVTVDSIVKAQCNGGGGAIVSVTGGATPYSFNWTGGSGFEDLSNVLAGTYNLTVTDANGCLGNISAVVSAVQPTTDPICLITVDTATGTNRLVWQKTPGLGIKEYKIYKEGSAAGVFSLVGTVLFNNLSAWTDSVSNPVIRAWKYKISTTDSCGNESFFSAEHKTMHLTMSIGLIQGSINLIWDHYQGFAFPTYYILRFKPVTGWKVLDSIPSTSFTYTDYNAPSLPGLRYFIAAKHPSANGCDATKSLAENHNTTRSNKTMTAAPPAPALTASTTVQSATSIPACDGSATITASGGVTPYTYNWSNGQTTSTATGLCVGGYSVTVTDVDTTKVVDSIFVVITGVAENVFNGDIRIYPNPNEGTFTLEIVTGENVRSMSIVNILDQEVWSSYVTKIPYLMQPAPHRWSQTSTIIDLSGKPPGVYFLKLNTGKGTVQRKVLVQ